MKYLWTTEGGNFIIRDKTREGAVRVIIQERIACGETLEEAINNFQTLDEIIAVDEPEYDCDSLTYIGDLPEDLWSY